MVRRSIVTDIDRTMIAIFGFFIVKDVLVERSTSERVANYEEVVEKTLEKTSKMQQEVLSNEEVTAQHLRFTIRSGYGHFVGVHGVQVMGSTASGRSPVALRKAR